MVSYLPIILTLGVIGSFLYMKLYCNHEKKTQGEYEHERTFNVNATSIPEVPEDSPERLYDIITISHDKENITLPEDFDARTQWPVCKDIIGKVWDQAACAACWAVSSTAVMSDRLCIKSNTTTLLSPQDLICNCKNCTKNTQGPQMPMCNGGDSEAAWKYWVSDGLVSGSDYGTNNSCMPYLTKPCMHGKSSADDLAVCSVIADKFTCPSTCAYNNESIAKEKKYKGSRIFYVQNNVEDIKKEILLNGPVQAKLQLTQHDFSVHKEGLYSPDFESNRDNDTHSVKIIGWGKTDNDVPYWLCVNSFGKKWGEEGLFRITQGNKAAKIEEAIMAGDPIIA